MIGEHVVVTLSDENSGSPEKLSDEKIASGKVNITTGLAMRSLCLEACKAGKIIAINDEEL